MELSGTRPLTLSMICLMVWRRIIPELRWSVPASRGSLSTARGRHTQHTHRYTLNTRKHWRSCFGLASSERRCPLTLLYDLKHRSSLRLEVRETTELVWDQPNGGGFHPPTHTHPRTIIHTHSEMKVHMRKHTQFGCIQTSCSLLYKFHAPWALEYSSYTTYSVCVCVCIIFHMAGKKESLAEV